MSPVIPNSPELLARKLSEWRAIQSEVDLWEHLFVWVLQSGTLVSPVAQSHFPL